jgi:hypothetical protein
MAIIGRFAPLFLTLTFSPISIARDDSMALRSSVKARHLQASCWTAPIAGLFMDVDVSCGFPPESQVVTSIHDREAAIVKLSSETFIVPDMASLNIRVLKPGTQASDLGAIDVSNSDVSKFLKPHQDACSAFGTTFPVNSGQAVYDNIKKFVDSFDIYTKCTKVYVPNKENGMPKMRKDDIIAIVTEPLAGHFTLSYEDVAQYEEYVDEHGTRTLVAIISSRKDNVIEGNYDITVQLFKNHTVRLAYTKRQNLAEALLKLGNDLVNGGRAGYILTTQDSVDKTMLKLAYAGRYGPAALDENSGCYQREHCIDYFRLQIGDVCAADKECATGKCEYETRWCLWNCTKRCVA